MASQPKLAELIQLGQEINSIKFYEVCLAALVVYDYFLTLNDEVLYAWKTESVLIFVLFLFIRYLPVLYQMWVIVALSYTEHTLGTAFFEILYYTLISASSQVFLAQRTYAITSKNKWVAGILYTIFTAQLGVGLYMSIWAAINPVADLPRFPLDSYRMCFAATRKGFTAVQMALCLAFDVAVFVLVVVQAQLIKSTHKGIGRPKILVTVTRDAEIYFAFITASHFLIVVMFAMAKEVLRTIPIVGNSVFIPIMIGRMIVSLKKAAGSQQPYMSTEHPPEFAANLQYLNYSHPVDSIQLSALEG